MDALLRVRRRVGMAWVEHCVGSHTSIFVCAAMRDTPQCFIEVVGRAGSGKSLSKHLLPQLWRSRCRVVEPAGLV